MANLELCREYYALCRPLLYERIPEVMAQAAIGMAGNRPECFGLEDELNDGPAFCIWLPLAILEQEREKIANCISGLPREYDGKPARLTSSPLSGPGGAIAIEYFYEEFTGLGHAPKNWREWLYLDEGRLAACVNGQVFEDNAGLFSKWRQRLLEYYPQDVWLKRLAVNCLLAAQSGQYILPRALKKGESGAAQIACGRFCERIFAIAFLLNRKYAPFYEWQGRLCRQLPVLGQETDSLVKALAEHPLRDSRDLGICAFIEEHCDRYAAHLNALGLSHERDNWLWAHGVAIEGRIKNGEIRRLKMPLGR